MTTTARASTHPLRITAKWALQSLLWTTGGSLLVYGILRGSGTVTPYWQLWAVGAAVLIVVKLIGSVIGPPPRHGVRPRDRRVDLPDLPFAEVKRWEERLDWTADDPQRYAEMVHPRLVAVLAEWLRRRHGVMLDDDPRRSRAILGDELYRFATEPPNSGPQPAELSRYLSHIEET